MSVNLIKDWQDKTIGDKDTNNSLRAIANFYVGPNSPDDSTDLLQYIALSLGYNYEDPNTFAMPYIQYINRKITGIEEPEGGSYLQTIVNHL